MRLFAATQGGLYRYQYGPGVVESEVDELDFFSIKVQTMLHAGVPISLECLVPDAAGVFPYCVRIYDAAGRLERAVFLDNTLVVLTPIRGRGVYFLTVNYHNKLHKKKIIVVD
jgi:hypothetical protein